MIWIAAGMICLLYFIYLCIRQVDFGSIWLLGAVGCLVCGGYLQYCCIYPNGVRFPVGIAMVLRCLALTGTCSFAITEMQIIRSMKTDMEKEAEYLIVLGAQVKRTVPSKALGLRLQTAARYLEQHPSAKAVLSGGQGEGEEISEARCMYQFLTDCGIQPERLLLEEHSATTWENLQNSAVVIKQDVENTQREKSFMWQEKRIALVSNNFHIYRAQKLAKKVGYQSVWGIAAPSDAKLQIHYMVREYFAVIKAKIKGNL